MLFSTLHSYLHVPYKKLSAEDMTDFGGKTAAITHARMSDCHSTLSKIPYRKDEGVI